MVDFARITVRAGDGGDGAGSFHKIKGKRYGKADGGPGGNGGNVYIEASADLSTLETYRYVKDYKAQSGQAGSSFRKRGAGGEDLVLKVPVGTQIKVSNVKEELKEPSILYDLVEEGQRVLVTRGGIGGRGNSQLKDEFGRRPRAGETGEEGETCQAILELKLIADVGLIGLPNAGKSTLLSALTKATPKIAPYPFTTLEPNLGVLNSSQLIVDSSQKENTVNRELITVNKPAMLVLADIPGLIEGASQGKGLGDLFLRHIERTRVLVHLVDCSQLIVDSSQNEKNKSTVNREPITVNSLWSDYQTVRKELKAYSGELAKKKEIIILNKIDQTDLQVVQGAIAEFAKHRKKVVAISAKEGTGLENLANLIVKATKKR